MAGIYEKGFSLSQPICSSHLVLLLSHNTEIVTSVISMATDCDVIVEGKTTL